LVDNVNKARSAERVNDVHRYFADNISKGQGIEAQINHINHQASVSAEMDNAVLNGDHYTAKTMEDDKAFLNIQSRIDAGFHNTIYEELVTPIENMSNDEFKTQYGYENMTNEEVSQRKQKVVQQAKDKIKDVKDAIKLADNIFTFNLGTEEGRLNRNMLIYSIATQKSVGDRIDSLNKIVNKNIEGRLGEYDYDESIYDTDIESYNKLIVDKQASKEGKTAEQIAKIDSQIETLQLDIDKANKNKALTIEAKNVIAEIKKNGFNPKTVEEARAAKRVIDKLHDKKLDAVGEGKYNETIQALDDLIKLNRRKEEAIELYALTKDPGRFNEF